MEFLPTTYKLLHDFEHLIPRWCELVLVEYKAGKPEIEAEIEARYDYRESYLKLTELFFKRKEQQVRTMVHELCHITQEPLWNTVVDVKTRLGELDPGNKEFVSELCRHAREQSVCDMTALMMGAWKL